MTSPDQTISSLPDLDALSIISEDERGPVLLDPANGLLDLSKQLRNLLLMRPVYTLELEKNHLHSAEGKASLLANLDTHYLVLALFDTLMEGVALAGGRTDREITQTLGSYVEAMDSSLEPNNVEIAAIAIFDAMTNRANGFKAFEYDYFHGPSASRRSFSFKLIGFTQGDGQEYLYKPTPEGYLVYLGMLDLSPEDSAELMEKMLDLLVKRGKYRDAIDIARRARAISIEYRQIIGDTIQRANRAPATVKWSETMTPRLNDARNHVEQRRNEDERMIGSIESSVTEVKELESKQDLYKLRDMLSKSSTIRTKLLTEIAAAPDEFLKAQKSVFRPRGLIGFPNIEDKLLPALMSAPVQDLGLAADEIVSALYKPRFPKIYDLNFLVTMAYTKKKVITSAEYQEPDLEILESIPPRFAIEVIDDVFTWLTGYFKRVDDSCIEEIIAAVPSYFDVNAKICLVLLLFRCFAKSESPIENIQVSFNGRRFRNDFAAGTSLQFKVISADERGVINE